MKRFYLFSVVALTAASMAAQGLSLGSVEQLEKRKIDVPEATSLSTVFSVHGPSSSVPVIKAPKGDIVYGCFIRSGFNAGFDELMYGYDAAISVGVAGKNNELHVYDTIPEGVTPTYTWKIVGDDGSETQLKTSPDTKTAYINTWGIIPFPVVNGTTSDGGTMGFDKAKDPELEATGGALFSGQFDKKFYLTASDPAYSMYTGFSFQNGGEVYYGTGIEDKDGNLLKGLAAFYEPQLSPMLIYGGNVVMYKVDESKDILQAGKDIVFELWSMELDETGVFTKLDKLGETSSGVDKLNAPGGGKLYTLKFDFTTTNDLGLEEDAPVLIPTGTRFGLIIKNVDEANFRVLMTSPSSLNYGSSYMIFDENYSQFTPILLSTNFPGGDMVINFQCDMPALEWDAERMDFPTEGGVGTTVGNFIDQEGNPIEQNIEWAFLMTSMPYLINPDMGDMSAKNFTFEAPEWVKNIQVAEYKEGDYGWDILHMYAVTAEADPLPAGETGRSGILMCTGPCGLKYGIKVGQGEWNPDDIEGGVESVAAPKAAVAVAGDNLMLTYGEEYNTVTVYNVAGSEVASYALPQGGSFEIPAADLNGVYMVVFEGASREVVKVVK